MVKMNMAHLEALKERLMPDGRQLLLAMLIPAVSHPGVEAEINRADMAEDLLAQEDTGPVVNLSDEPADVLRDWLSENPSTMLHGRVARFDFLPDEALPEGANRNLGVRPIYVVADREGIVRAIRVGSVKTSAPGAMLEYPGAVRIQPYF